MSVSTFAAPPSPEEPLKRFFCPPFRTLADTPRVPSRGSPRRLPDGSRRARFPAIGSHLPAPPFPASPCFLQLFEASVPGRAPNRTLESSRRTLRRPVKTLVNSGRRDDPAGLRSGQRKKKAPMGVMEAGAESHLRTGAGRALRGERVEA